MSQILHLSGKELRLFDIETDASVLESLQNFVDTSGVFFYGVAEYYDVVEINQTCLPFVLRQYQIESSLKRRRCICQAEGHSNVLKDSAVCDKGCFVTILLANLHLPW